MRITSHRDPPPTWGACCCRSAAHQPPLQGLWARGPQQPPPRCGKEIPAASAHAAPEEELGEGIWGRPSPGMEQRQVHTYLLTSEKSPFSAASMAFCAM
jgi:hypothetical protein